MRKLKKFKRYDEGGAVGAGSGDPFSYTDFSNRERNLRKPSEAAPIEERKPPKAEETEPAKAEPAKAERAPPPSGRREIPPTPLTKEEKRADYEGGVDATSGSQTFTASKPPKAAAGSSASSGPRPSAPKPKPPAPAKAEPSKPSYVGAGDSDDSEDTKKKTELERLKRVGSGAVEQTMMGPAEIGLFGALGGIPSKVRAGIGLAKKGYEELTKPAAKPAEKSEPKLDSKAEPKQGELFDAKGNPTAEATGAKPASKPKPKEAPKSGAIQPTGKGPSEAGRKAMEGSKGSLKEQAVDAVNKQRAADKDPRGPVSGAIQPTGKGPSEAGSKLMREAGGNKPKGPGRLPLKEQAVDAINKQRAADKDPRGPITERSRSARPTRSESKPIRPTGAGPSEAGKKLMERTNSRSSTILEKERKPDLAMQEYISGRDAVRTRARDLPDDGLSTTRYANKKGGKIPAFKKGGLVGRGDGCAMRGRTKGRVV